jgi:hypothetical protein
MTDPPPLPLSDITLTDKQAVTAVLAPVPSRHKPTLEAERNLNVDFAST